MNYHGLSAVTTFPTEAFAIVVNRGEIRLRPKPPKFPRSSRHQTVVIGSGKFRGFGPKNSRLKRSNKAPSSLSHLMSFPAYRVKHIAVECSPDWLNVARRRDDAAGQRSTSSVLCRMEYADRPCSMAEILLIDGHAAAIAPTRT